MGTTSAAVQVCARNVWLAITAILLSATLQSEAAFGGRSRAYKKAYNEALKAFDAGSFETAQSKLLAAVETSEKLSIRSGYLGEALTALGRVHLAATEWDEAATVLSRAVEVSKKTYRSTDGRVLYASVLLSDALIAKNDLDAAHDLLVEIRDTYRRTGTFDQGISQAARRLGYIHARQGDYAKAEESFLEAREKVAEGGRPGVAKVRATNFALTQNQRKTYDFGAAGIEYALADVYVAQGKFDQALEVCLKQFEREKREEGFPGKLRLAALKMIVESRRRMGDPKAGDTLLNRELQRIEAMDESEWKPRLRDSVKMLQGGQKRQGLVEKLMETDPNDLDAVEKQLTAVIFTYYIGEKPLTPEAKMAPLTELFALQAVEFQLFNQGDVNKARAIYDLANLVYRRKYASESKEYGRFLRSRLHFLFKTGNHIGVGDLLDEYANRADEFSGNIPAGFAQNVGNLTRYAIQLYQSTNNYRFYEDCHHRNISIQEEAFGESHPETWRAIFDYLDFLRANDRGEDADRLQADLSLPQKPDAGASDEEKRIYEAFVNFKPERERAKAEAPRKSAASKAK